MRVASARILRLALVLGTVGILGATAQAHPHKTVPPVTVDIQITGDGVDGTAVMQVPVLEVWLGASLTTPDDGDADARTDRVLQALKERMQVTVDGKAVTPEAVKLEKLMDLQLAGDTPTVPSWQLRFRFPDVPAVKRQQVDVAWTNFEGILWEDEAVVPVTVVAQQKNGISLADAAYLEVEDPQHTWHRPKNDWDFRKEAAPVEVEAPPRATLEVPLLSVLLGGLAVLLVLAMVLQRVAVRRVVGTGVLLLALAGAAWPLARVTVADPRAPTVHPPTEAQAVQIFTTLHENLYGALAAADESAAFDHIAQSVEPALVERIYFDIRESMILRGQGGVVAGVERIEHLDHDVVFPEDGNANRFQMDWTWRVHGFFAHQGHVHKRVNFYVGRYQVVRREGRWRLASLQLLDDMQWNSVDGELPPEATAPLDEAPPDPWAVPAAGDPTSDDTGAQDPDAPGAGSEDGEP